MTKSLKFNDFFHNCYIGDWLDRSYGPLLKACSHMGNMHNLDKRALRVDVTFSGGDTSILLEQFYEMIRLSWHNLSGLSQDCSPGAVFVEDLRTRTQNATKDRVHFEGIVILPEEPGEWLYLHHEWAVALQHSLTHEFHMWEVERLSVSAYNYQAPLHCNPLRAANDFANNLVRTGQSKGVNRVWAPTVFPGELTEQAAVHGAEPDSGSTRPSHLQDLEQAPEAYFSDQYLKLYGSEICQRKPLRGLEGVFGLQEPLVTSSLGAGGAQ